MFNSTDEIDTFPLSYEDDQFDSLLINRSVYEEIFKKNSTSSSSSIFSFSSPFTFLFLIISSYLILTLILLTFSLYKQRQMEIENFYFGDTDEEIEQGKRHFQWKQFLIDRIEKGDMEPLLTNQNEQRTFPLDIV